MRIESSGLDPSTIGRGPDQASAAPDQNDPRKRTAGSPQVPAQAQDGAEAASSARVTLSPEAKARLAGETQDGTEQDKPADPRLETGSLSSLLQKQKERVASPPEDAAIKPPPIRPSPQDESSIRAAEQRLAAQGLSTTTAVS